MYSLYVQVNAGGFTARIIPSMEPADRSALRDLTGRPRVINLPIHDASSIEVVRGPNSALYGRTTIGGAVNVRTSEPTAGHEADFDLTGGGFGFVKGVARASGPAADWGGYFVSAASERNNGFYHVGVAGVFGRFSIEPTSRLILTAGGRYDRLDLENTLTFRDGCRWWRTSSTRSARSSAPPSSCCRTTRAPTGPAPSPPTPVLPGNCC